MMRSTSTRLCNAMVPTFAAPLATGRSASRAIKNGNHSLRPWEPTCAVQEGKDVVFYYETANPDSLVGYQCLAGRVCTGDLPGDVVNSAGSCGYATWTVPHEEFRRLVSER